MPKTARFVLKGGVLLAAFDARRPTQDVDLHSEHVNGDVESVLGMIRSIAAIDVEDGLVFSPEQARRGDQGRGAVRRRPGDPCLFSCPRRRHLPRRCQRWRPDHARAIARCHPQAARGRAARPWLPLAMVHAEKIVTALAGGVANTRWRDFGDLYILSQRHDVDGAELASALASVASRREIELRPLAVVLTGYAELAQHRYHAWRRKNRRDEIPEQFAKVLIHVIAFADPALGGQSRRSSGVRPPSTGSDRKSRSGRPARAGRSMGSVWASGSAR